MDALLLKTVIDGQNGKHKGIILDGIQIHMVNIYSPYLFFVFVSFFLPYFTFTDIILLSVMHSYSNGYLSYTLGNF